MRGSKSRSVNVHLDKDHKTRSRRIVAFSSRESHAWRVLTKLADKSIYKLEAKFSKTTVVKKTTDTDAT